MTRAEALREARRRWGSTARVSWERNPIYGRTFYIDVGGLLAGVGDDWKSAMANAKRRFARRFRRRPASPPDRGLALALSLAADDLDAIESHFEDRADLDNDESRLLLAVRRVITLHARIAANKPAPSRVGYAMGSER